jgi:hypothetical protein
MNLRYTRREFLRAVALAAIALEVRAQGTPAGIPMTLKNGIYYVDAQVNGVAVVLLVDTGASVTLLNRNFAGLAGIQQGAVRALGGQVKAQRAQIHLRVGDRAFAADAMIGDFRIPDADGCIGSDVLTACGMVTFDFEGKTLLLYRAGRTDTGAGRTGIGGEKP